jgi:hypothetical protein
MNTNRHESEGEGKRFWFWRPLTFWSVVSSPEHSGSCPAFIGGRRRLEPLKPQAWPAGFFDQIHIADPEFERFDKAYYRR